MICSQIFKIMITESVKVILLIFQRKPNISRLLLYAAFEMHMTKSDSIWRLSLMFHMWFEDNT